MVALVEHLWQHLLLYLAEYLFSSLVAVGLQRFLTIQSQCCYLSNLMNLNLQNNFLNLRSYLTFVIVQPWLINLTQ